MQLVPIMNGTNSPKSMYQGSIDFSYCVSNHMNRTPCSKTMELVPIMNKASFQKIYVLVYLFIFLIVFNDQL